MRQVPSGQSLSVGPPAITSDVTRRKVHDDVKSKTRSRLKPVLHRIANGEAASAMPSTIFPAKDGAHGGWDRSRSH
jgi:hypothetical protein